jgi:cobalamin biosynthesis protein CobD/CbiB
MNSHRRFAPSAALSLRMALRRWHPLVGFGNLASMLEKKLNNRHISSGLLAWLLVVGPWVALAFWLRPFAPFAVDVALLYFALGAQPNTPKPSPGRCAKAAGRGADAGQLDGFP